MYIVVPWRQLAEIVEANMKQTLQVEKVFKECMEKSEKSAEFQF